MNSPRIPVERTAADLGHFRDCYVLLTIAADDSMNHKRFQSKDEALAKFRQATKPGVDAAVYHYDSDGRCTVIARALHEHQ